LKKEAFILPLSDITIDNKGILSHKDIALAVHENGELEGARVKHVMKSPVHVITAHANIAGTKH